MLEIYLILWWHDRKNNQNQCRADHKIIFIQIQWQAGTGTGLEHALWRPSSALNMRCGGQHQHWTCTMEASISIEHALWRPASALNKHWWGQHQHWTSTVVASISIELVRTVDWEKWAGLLSCISNLVKGITNVSSYLKKKKKFRLCIL